MYVKGRAVHAFRHTFATETLKKRPSKRVTEHALALANAPTKDWAAYVKAYYAPDATFLPPECGGS